MNHGLSCFNTLIILSALTWNAGLKHTGVTLELLQDIHSQKNMYLVFVEAAIRGGISTAVTKRRAVANNRHDRAALGPLIKLIENHQPNV